MDLVVGKLYRIKFPEDPESTWGGLCVYENPWRTTYQQKASWIYLIGDNIVMWLGTTTAACRNGFGALLYIDKVWYVRVDAANNSTNNGLHKLERILL